MKGDSIEIHCVFSSFFPNEEPSSPYTKKKKNTLSLPPSHPPSLSFYMSNEEDGLYPCNPQYKDLIDTNVMQYN